MNCIKHQVEADKNIKHHTPFDRLRMTWSNRLVSSNKFDRRFTRCLAIVPIILVLLFSLSTCLTADTMIFIPTGNTLGEDQTKFEGLLSNSNKKGNFFHAAGGFEQFEIGAFRYEYPHNPKAEFKYNMQWNFLPETFFTPAIAFGLMDISSQSKEGIGPYAVLTKKLPVTLFTRYIEDLSATMGFGVKNVHGFFFGFEGKLPSNMFAQVEFDSDYWNSAIGWEPLEGLRFKVCNINSDQFFGIEFKNGGF